MTYPVIYDIDSDIQDLNSPQYGFHCYACACDHWFKTTGDYPRWTWNSDYFNPTVEPSIAVKHTRNNQKVFCHFFIRNGEIQYCLDSSHDLAGLTFKLRGVDE